MLCILWQMCDITGLIFIAANGQILKNNRTIWSHWQQATTTTKKKRCPIIITASGFTKDAKHTHTKPTSPNLNDQIILGSVL